VRRGRLAVLSACFTAHGGAEELQDEVSHLACALYAAGYPAVVGSLWPAGEDRMHFLLERFYAQLKNAAAGSGLAPGPVMEAFHGAVLELRESTRSEFNDYCGDPVEWAQFVMIGC
jgi:CHAT domain-containing protein